MQINSDARSRAAWLTFFWFVVTLAAFVTAVSFVQERFYGTVTPRYVSAFCAFIAAYLFAARATKLHIEGTGLSDFVKGTTAARGFGVAYVVYATLALVLAFAADQSLEQSFGDVLGRAAGLVGIVSLIAVFGPGYSEHIGARKHITEVNSETDYEVTGIIPIRPTVTLGNQFRQFAISPTMILSLVAVFLGSVYLYDNPFKLSAAEFIHSCEGIARQEVRLSPKELTLTPGLETVNLRGFDPYSAVLKGNVTDALGKNTQVSFECFSDSRRTIWGQFTNASIL